MSKLFIKNISPELEEQLRRYCEENNLTLKEAIEQALHLLLQSGKQEARLRLIITKYQGVCAICRQSVNIGELAYWDSNDKRIVCVKCYTQAHSELKDAKRLYELYKAIRRLKALKRLAEQELEEIMHQIDAEERLMKLHEIAEQLNTLIPELRSYIFNVEKDNVNLQEILNQLIQISEKLDEYLATHRLQLRKSMKKVLEKEA